MPFYYVGSQSTFLPFDPATPGGTAPYSALYRTSFNREVGSKAEVLKHLQSVSRDVPLGTEVVVRKVYRQKRGYEPNAPFSSGGIAEEETYRLVEHGSFYDPATGRPRPPKWVSVERRTRKSSVDDWTTKTKAVKVPRFVEGGGSGHARRGGALQRRYGRARGGVSAKAPATMTAGEINRELDKLDKLSSKITDEFIEAGRGYERPSETRTKNDPLALRWSAVADRQAALRNEKEIRMGPGTHNLRAMPREFGPRRRDTE